MSKALTREEKREQIEAWRSWYHSPPYSIGGVATTLPFDALCDLALASLSPARVEGEAVMGPTEEMVEAGARVIAESPGIDAPKLDYPCWMGLARKVIEAALSAAPALSASGDTAKLVSKLEGLSAKATPEPWQAAQQEGGNPYIYGGAASTSAEALARPPILSGLWPIHQPEETQAAEDQTFANIHLAAALRNAVPQILAALSASGEARDAAADALREALRQIIDRCSMRMGTQVSDDVVNIAQAALAADPQQKEE